MKFLLSVEQPPILSGYTIVSPINGQSPLDLSMIDDGEATEIICHHVLQFVPIENMRAYLELLSKKLSHGGKLIITSYDAISLVADLYHNRIDTYKFNQIIYGSKQWAWDFKQSIVSLDEVNEIVRELGLRVNSRKLHNHQFSIICERT